MDTCDDPSDRRMLDHAKDLLRRARDVVHDEVQRQINIGVNMTDILGHDGKLLIDIDDFLAIKS